MVCHAEQHFLGIREGALVGAHGKPGVVSLEANLSMHFRQPVSQDSLAHFWLDILWSPQK